MNSLQEKKIIQDLIFFFVYDFNEGRNWQKKILFSLSLKDFVCKNTKIQD